MWLIYTGAGFVTWVLLALSVMGIEYWKHGAPKGSWAFWRDFIIVFFFWWLWIIDSYDHTYIDNTAEILMITITRLFMMLTLGVIFYCLVLNSINWAVCQHLDKYGFVYSWSLPGGECVKK